jgi:hypothetical protein
VGDNSKSFKYPIDRNLSCLSAVAKKKRTQG